LQRLIWTGKVLFEIKTMEARPDGFLLTFTKPVDRERAEKITTYQMSSYTYPYHSTYGGAELETKRLTIRKATLSVDSMSVRLNVDGLREGYVHELHVNGMLSAGGEILLHAPAFYTLNRIP
jgi:hypothetical protein